MKFLAAALTTAFVLFTLAACSTFPPIPVDAKACYTTASGQQVCVGTDGHAIKIDASFRGQK